MLYRAIFTGEALGTSFVIGAFNDVGPLVEVGVLLALREGVLGLLLLPEPLLLVALLGGVLLLPPKLAGGGVTFVGFEAGGGGGVTLTGGGGGGGLILTGGGGGGLNAPKLTPGNATSTAMSDTANALPCLMCVTSVRVDVPDVAGDGRLERLGRAGVTLGIISGRLLNEVGVVLDRLAQLRGLRLELGLRRLEGVDVPCCLAEVVGHGLHRRDVFAGRGRVIGEGGELGELKAELGVLLVDLHLEGSHRVDGRGHVPDGVATGREACGEGEDQSGDDGSTDHWLCLLVLFEPCMDALTSCRIVVERYKKSMESVLLGEFTKALPCYSPFYSWVVNVQAYQFEN